jgi:polysaccharide deacetylase family protein (PEP-CTERM system associated)
MEGQSSEMKNEAGTGLGRMKNDKAVMVNAMTVDVEDYYHANALESFYDRSRWSSLERRVDGNTRRILDLFDEHGVKGTFFILGSVAEEFPLLTREIVNRGHELASHGYEHFQAFRQSPSEFRNDVSRTKKSLEDITGVEIRGYRAASFSISSKNWWAFDVLRETGHTYSSSTSISSNRLFRMPSERRYPFNPVENNFMELPITSFALLGMTFPAGGGGYFRLLPYSWYRYVVNSVNTNEEMPAVFYFHPWEIDPEQPRASVNAMTRFRHYNHLASMESKIAKALKDFRWGRMDEVFSKVLAGQPTD